MKMTTYTPKVWGSQRSTNGDGKVLTGMREGVVLHHTVTKALPANASAAEEKTRMRALESIGYSRYGTGIAYNEIFFPSGNSGLGVAWNRRGTHTGGHNSRFYAFSLDGDYRSKAPTVAQKNKMAARLVELYRDRRISQARIVGVHSDFAATACPGGKAREAVDDINRRAQAILDKGSSSKPGKPPVVNSKGLEVDGRWGRNTTRRLQAVLGTPVDGEVWNQNRRWKARNPGLTSGWKWKVWTRNLKGSPVIKAMQRVLKVDPDGIIGPHTINALSARYGIKGDGKLDNPSITIKAMQRALNSGKF